MDLTALFKAVVEIVERVLSSIPRWLISLILAWRFKRQYLRDIEREFKEWGNLYAPLEVWGTLAPSGKLYLKEFGRPLGSLLDHVDDGQRIILTGEAGTGKTTTLRHLAYHYAVQVRQGQSRYLPILASLSDLKEPTLQGVMDMLKRATSSYERKSWLERQGVTWGKKISDRIEDLLEDGQVVVLMDGLNEIAAETRLAGFAALKEFLQLPKYSSAKVIVTSRAGPNLEQLAVDCQRFDLMPLSDAAMQTFLAMRQINVETALRRLSGVNLKDICRNPGLLNMFADLYKRPDLNLPPTRGQVLKAYVEVLLRDGQEKWNPSYRWRWVDRGLMIDALGRLAHDMIGQGDTRLAANHAALIIAEVIASQQGVEPNDVLEAASFCLLLEFLADRTEIRFKHDLFRSYLAAEFLERQIRNGKLSELTGFMAGKRWWEPLLLQAGITARPLLFTKQLVAVQPAETAVPVALGCLLSASPERLAEEDAQKYIDLRQSLSALLFDLFRDDPGMTLLREASAWAANLVGSHFVEILGQLLAPVLGQPIRTRLAAVELLREVRSEYSIEALLMGLTDPEAEVRQASSQGLTELEKQFGLTEEQITHLVYLMTDDAHYRPALRVLLTSTNPARLPRLIDALAQEQHPPVRATLRYALHSAGNREAAVKSMPEPVSEVTEGLVVAWSQYAQHPDSAAELVRLLQAITGPDQQRCFEPLVDLVRNSVVEVAVNALRGLQMIHASDALPLIADIAAQLDAPAESRVAALRALFAIDRAYAVPRLAALLPDTNWQIQEAATDLLSMAGREAVDQLVPYLQNERKDLQRNVIRLLGTIGDQRAVPALVLLVDDDDWSIRAQVAWALGRLGDPTTSAVLQALSADGNRFVRQEALRSLEAVNLHRLTIPVPVTSVLTMDSLFSALSVLTDEFLCARPPSWFGRIFLRIQGRSVDYFESIAGNESSLIACARSLMARGEYTVALVELSRIIDSNKNHVVARLWRTMAFLATNRYEDACADCDCIIGLQPNWSIGYLLRARAHRLLNPEQALRDAQRAVSLSLSNPVALCELGYAYLINFRYREAEDQFRRVIEVSPTSVVAHLGLASISYMELRFEDALALVNTAIDLQANYIDSYLLRGTLLCAIGYEDLAQFDLDSIAQLAPDSEIEHLVKAVIDVMRGQFEQALKQCDQAIQINPYSTALWTRVMVLIFLDRAEEAVAEGDRLIRLHPNVGLIYLLRGLALMVTGKPGLGLDDLNRFTSVSPDFALGYMIRATFYGMLEERALAKLDIDKAIGLAPFTPLLYLLRSAIDVEDNQLEVAVQDLGRAIELSPRAWVYRISRARLSLRLQDFTCAEGDLKVAAEIWGETIPILDGWASFYLIRGQYSEAQAQLKAIDELDPNQAVTRLKRGLIRLLTADTESALQEYTEIAPRATVSEIEVALSDMDSIPSIPDQQKQLVHAILDPYVDPMSGWLDLRSELATVTSFLA